MPVTLPESRPASVGPQPYSPEWLNALTAEQRHSPDITEFSRRLHNSGGRHVTWLHWSYQEKHLWTPPVAAAAMLLARDSPRGLDAEALYRTLACCAQDMAARKTRADVAVTALLRMPVKQRDDVIAMLRTAWRSEREAELKMAIADVMVRAMTQQTP